MRKAGQNATHRSSRGASLLAGLLLLIAIGAGCSKGPDPLAQGPTAMPVKVAVAQDVPVDDTTEYVATLKSRDSAVVMPQVEGVVTEIYVHSGQQVAAGIPLMQIDPSKQQATDRKSTRLNSSHQIIS